MINTSKVDRQFRTCQDCGKPAFYMALSAFGPSPAFMSQKCKFCKSSALTYGTRIPPAQSSAARFDEEAI